MQEWLANVSLPASNPATILLQAWIQGAARDRVAQTLRQSAQRDLDGRQYYIPPACIRDQFSHEVVLKLLKLFLPTWTEVDALELANFIAPDLDASPCSVCSQTRCTGRRLLFLGLIAIAKESSMDRFRRCLQELEHQGTCDILLDAPIRGEVSIGGSLSQLIAEWLPAEKETVTRLFRRVQSYFFERSMQQWRWNNEKGEMEPPQWNVLHESITLPWMDPPEVPAPTRVQTSDSMETRLPSSEGDFAKVRKVNIHPEYHSLGDTGASFALKELRKNCSPHNSERQFRDEIAANLRVASHDRVVTFITVFEHRDTKYLLFPWADGGNLTKMYMNLTPVDVAGPEFPNWCNPDWLLDQCVGLAEGLADMHDPRDTQVVDNPTSPSFHNRRAQIHADIWPDNILAFSTNCDGRGPYTLKLADLGLSRELGDNGKVKMNEIRGGISWRAPEGDLARACALPQWDIWCLGCTFLELVTWFFTGYHGVDEFTNKRDEERNDLLVQPEDDSEDTFFRLTCANPWTVRIPGVGARRGAEVKACVREQIRTLRDEPPRLSDERIQKLLDFVQCHMIVIADQRRATARQVYDELYKIRHMRQDLTDRAGEPSQANGAALQILWENP